MSPSQVQSGHAFEYGIACAFGRVFNSKLKEDKIITRAKNAFQDCDEKEQEKIVRASDEIAVFLIAHDNNLKPQQGYEIYIQSDQSGGKGDVRDVVIKYNKKEVGISAKNRHSAVKHSRVSEKIDFGYKWFGIHCDPVYFHQIIPVFRELRTLHKQGVFWRDLENKSSRFYIPVLHAFKEEAGRLCNNPEAPKKMVEYIMGKYDFYKAIKENGDISIQSFNMHGTLGWGKHIKLPTRLIEAREKNGSENTLIFTFDEGWQLSFRIHNAESRVTPSLKFDVQIVGLPNASQHQIHYFD